MQVELLTGLEGKKLMQKKNARNNTQLADHMMSKYRPIVGWWNDGYFTAGAR